MLEDLLFPVSYFLSFYTTFNFSNLFFLQITSIFTTFVLLFSTGTDRHSDDDARDGPAIDLHLAA